MKPCLLLAALFLTAFPAFSAPAEHETSPSPWTPERAWTWYRAQPWPCGFNYVPANAISYTEMWMAKGYDPARIDRELALAQDIGFNSVRVVLSFVVWEAEPDAFLKRLDSFLALCDRHGLKVMIAPFDDCVFGPITDPVFGPQPDVVPGWYANGWTPSPGHKLVRDTQAWPRLERFVRAVIGRFRNDPRVWVWDLYNEPTNGPGNDSLPLLEQVVRWARDERLAAPLTIGVWNDNEALNDIALRASDVVTFHSYDAPDKLEALLTRMLRTGRPVICTEWMNRVSGSTISACLPVFQKHKVGCLQWGLVNGRTQTHLNWGHRPGQPEPKVWQHDLFRPDLTPYDPEEIKLLRKAIKP